MIRIIQADVMAGLATIPDNSVHCVVTSPPYWGLRDYNVEGQIGLEKTPEEYVGKMVDVFREVRRVLRDDGTLWLNLGDSYVANASNQVPQTKRHIGSGFAGPNREGMTGLEPKNLVGIPWRVAFALQADGWYLRSDIIWSKPNPMPESVTDRPTKSHEYVFLLTKKVRYFYDADAVREAYNPDSIDRYKYTLDGTAPTSRQPNGDNDRRKREANVRDPNPAGRNRRTVWEITTQPFPAAHFATFPEALVEPCIKAGTSERGCCPVCGAPWVRVVEKELIVGSGSKGSRGCGDAEHGMDNRWKNYPRGTWDIKNSGWQPTCTCSDDTTPCTVLDPFAGSGTVGKVARDLNRDAILIEINPEYVKIARQRLRADEQLIPNVEVVRV